MCNPCLMVCLDTVRSLKIQSHVSAIRFLKVRRRKNVSVSKCDPCLKVCFDTLGCLMVQRHILAVSGGCQLPALPQVRATDLSMNDRARTKDEHEEAKNQTKYAPFSLCIHLFCPQHVLSYLLCCSRHL